MFQLSIKCDNAAFEDAPGEEVARILRKIADILESTCHGEDVSGTCRDANGNRVGEWSLNLGGGDE